ncbi:DNA binding protein [Aureococcus anophagefferens]|nr:DNA binding protein [Aureococcus anophagefferens]
MPSWHAGTTGAVEDLFIPAKTYEGSRPGYVFSTRDGRTGYYSDARAAKRPRDDGAESAAAGSCPTTAASAILAKADEAEITELDAASLKRLLLSLEKKITRNQQLRVKYGDDPSRWRARSIWTTLQQMGLCGGRSSTGRSATSAASRGRRWRRGAAAIEAAQGLEVLASNVARFDEAVTEEAEAVHNTLGVFENVLDVGGPGAAEAVAAKTCLGPWLLARAGVKGFGPIKLYASEILSILAGASEAAAGAFAEAEVGGADGVDALLTACAYYRKRAPAVGDEEECVENLFQALGSLVSSAPATTLPRLVRSEGVELLVKCSSPSSGRGAIVAGDKRSRQRGGKIKRRRRLVDDQRDLDEHVVSVAASICLYAGPEAPDLAMKRLLAKFAEDDCRAVKGLADRYAAYARDVRAAAEDPVAAASGPDARLARSAGLHAPPHGDGPRLRGGLQPPGARRAPREARRGGDVAQRARERVADYARDVGSGADAATGDASSTRRPRPGRGSPRRPGLGRRALRARPAVVNRVRRTMSSFHGNSGQDWSTVNVGRSAKPFKKPTDADKKQDLTKALRTGGVATSARMGGATNKTVAGHGIMGTTAGAGARKIEEETETFKVQKTGLAFGKALMQARTAKKMSQKDLGTKINEKPQVIQQYEGGKAVPNPQVISKIERALGVKLPRPPKVQKVKD